MTTVLVIDCVVGGSEAGGWRSFARHLPEARVVPVHAPAAPLPADPTRFDAVILTGSPASIVEPPPWVEGVERFVRRAVDARVAVLGVCFGHQLIARALAGPRAVGRAPRPEVGFPRIDLVGEDPIVRGLPSPLVAFVAHEDEVRASGHDFRILARSEGCAVQLMRLPDRPVWGVQFHAEMSRAEAEEVIRDRARLHPELGLDPDAVLAEAVDHADVAKRLFANFLAEAEREATGGPRRSP